MKKISTLIAKNVRCFSSLVEIPVSPLTLLVGDNSSGKSTFLSLYRIAWDLVNSRNFRRINFNELPFEMGGYDQIATYRGGRAGRATTFSIGMKVPVASSQKHLFGSDGEIEFLTKFGQSGSHPVIVEESLRSGDVSITISRAGAGKVARISVNINGDIYSPELMTDNSPLSFLERDVPIDFGLLSYLLKHEVRRKDGNSTPAIPDIAMSFLDGLLRGRRSSPTARPLAGAPVRTKPERVYTPISDSPVPEGGHVPMVLARMFFEDKERWELIKSSLDSFGRAAGLFKSIEIKSLGRHEGDPFQLRFKHGSQPTNLLDMGYGVSQVLPILVDSLLSEAGQTHLLQQPEVHLHPRGQAALGTFLSDMVSSSRRRFIVETHSDYLIDRIRMDVRDKKGISHEDVRILFFHNESGEVNVHSIGLDKNGELVDVPEHYRDFFLGEERRFLLGGVS